MSFDLLGQAYRKIPAQIKICFISGIITGWLTHFYMLSHKLLNWDDVNNISAYGSGDYLGRWFLKYIHPLGSIYSIPAVHGFLFIVCLSLSACIIADIMQIKSKTAAILIPAVLLTFPSAVSTMTFMFMAHTSGIAILMTCAAVWLLRRFKYGFLPCCALLVCVLGTYQSYISFAITLMLMGMICDIFHGKKFKEELKTGILCAAVLIACVLIYMWLSHIIYPNIDNETYGGVGNMGHIAVSEMPRLIGRCYKRFLEYFLWKPFAFVTKTAQRANILTCALALILFAVLSVQKKVYKDVYTFAVLVIACAFMPLAAAFVYFMAPEADYSMLMLYAYALIYVLVMSMLDYCICDWENNNQNLQWKNVARHGIVFITVAVIFVVCYADYLLANRAYLRTHIATERVQAYFNRIISMAESTDGFMPGDKLTILGEFYYRDNPSSVEIDWLDSEDLRELSGVALENGLITSGVRDNFIKIFNGYETADLGWDEKLDIMNTAQYKAMPVYPQEGCTQKINGIWVVKLCE